MKSLPVVQSYTLKCFSCSYSDTALFGKVRAIRYFLDIGWSVDEDGKVRCPVCSLSK